MSKKLTIYSVSLLLLALGSFFIYKDIAKNNFKIADLNTNSSGVASTSVDSVVPAGTVKLDCSKFSDFLNRSFVFPGNFNAETQNSYSERINKLVSSLKSNCNSFGTWLDLGQWYGSIGDYDAAKFAWETASQMEPNSFLPYHNLGNLYGFFVKDMKKSEEYYFKAIDKDLNSLNSYSDLADLYLYGGQPQKAIDLLKGGLNQSMLTNSYAFFLQKLAFVYRESGDKANALKYFEMLFSADPANVSAKQEIEILKAQ